MSGMLFWLVLGALEVRAWAFGAAAGVVLVHHNDVGVPSLSRHLNP